MQFFLNIFYLISSLAYKENHICSPHQSAAYLRMTSRIFHAFYQISLKIPNVFHCIRSGTNKKKIISAYFHTTSKKTFQDSLLRFIWDATDKSSSNKTILAQRVDYPKGILLSFRWPAHRMCMKSKKGIMFEQVLLYLQHFIQLASIFTFDWRNICARRRKCKKTLIRLACCLSCCLFYTFFSVFST